MPKKLHAPNRTDQGDLVAAVTCWLLYDAVAPAEAAEKFCCGSTVCCQCENNDKCGELRAHLDGFHPGHAHAT